MKNTLFITILLALFSCTIEDDGSDAYGNFEATEITVSAENSGKILHLDFDEGDVLSEGELVGYIDTTRLYLQKKQLLATGEVLKARFPKVSAELSLLFEQKANLRRELQRFEELASQGAVPTKQVDDLSDQIGIVDKRIDVAKSQNRPLAEELEVVRVQVEQIEDQIEDAGIIAPISGTVLLKLAEAGEIASPGMPLFRMADLRHLILRAYISGTQLDDISIGQEVTVLTDRDKQTYHNHRGVVTWISDEAEFTPKVIQTKEERTDLVYAVKIKVPNDGSLKIGMPGEVVLDTEKKSGNDQHQ